MQSRTAQRLVWFLFLAVLILRLWLAFSIPHHSSDAAYFHLRQAEHIREYGRPLFNDPLSWSASQVFLPLFDYLLAGVSLIMSIDSAAKLIPNLFAALLIPLIFGIARRRTGPLPSLFAALTAGFIPVFFAKTINQASPLPVALYLLFFLLYAFGRASEPGWAMAYALGLVVFTFFHPLVYLLVISIGIYLLLMMIQHNKQHAVELELSLFSIFFVLWGGLLVYKRLLLFHGPAVLWQNLPRALLSNYFAGISITGTLFMIGALPVTVGVFVMWRHLFWERRRDFYMTVSFILTTAGLLWLRLLPLTIGLSLLGLMLALLFARGAHHFEKFMSSTRARSWMPIIWIALICLFVITSVLPSVRLAQEELANGVSREEIAALRWVSQHTPSKARIAAAPDDGFLIMAVAERRNVMDHNFFLRNDAEQRYNDLRRLFITSFKTEALILLDRLHADIIYLSPQTAKAFGVSNLAYADAGGCLRMIYENPRVRVMQRKPGCEVRET